MVLLIFNRFIQGDFQIQVMLVTTSFIACIDFASMPAYRQGMFPGNHDHAITVSHNDITWIDQHSAATDGEID